MLAMRGAENVKPQQDAQQHVGDGSEETDTE
jgi:hypothetical protein